MAMADLEKPLLDPSCNHDPLNADERFASMEHPEFDYCFHFEMPGWATRLRRQITEDGHGADARRKKTIEEALKNLHDVHTTNNDKFLEKIKARSEMRGGRIAEADGGAQIQDLLNGFVHEEVDRYHMDLRDGMQDLQDAQTMAVDILLNFFRREEEQYNSFLFQSLDGRDLFLCVRFSEQSALQHAEQSKYLVQLADGALEQLDIILKPEKPDNTAFLPFIPFLRRGSLLRLYRPESRPEANAVHCLRKVDRIRLLYDRVTDIIDCNAMKRWMLLKDFFPLHSHDTLARLRKTWGRMGCICSFEQPIEEIHFYFGSQITLYFVFVGMLCKYTMGLIAATCGITMLVLVETGSIHETLHGFLLGSRFHYHRMAQAVVTVLWFQLFVCQLRQRINWYMNQWGDDVADTSDVKKLENERFSAPAMPSEVDASVLSYEATISQRRRGAVKSAVLTLVFILFTLGCVAGIFRVGAFLDQSGQTWGFTAAAYAVSVQIKVLQLVWDQLSLKLVDLELHQFAATFDSSRALKTFIFSAINAFASFFYVAFAMEFLEGCPETYPDGCWGYLCHEMIIVFALYVLSTLYDIVVPYGSVQLRIYLQSVNQRKSRGEKLDIWKLLRELLPALRGKRTSCRLKPGAGISGQSCPESFAGGEEEEEELSFLEVQARMETYGGAEQIEDYCQIVIPLAFVLMFGITLPFCCVLSLLCFALQLRADAFKLTRATKRPFPSRCTIAKRGGALGVWMVVLQLLSFLATATNSALIVFNLAPFKDWALNDQLVLFYTFILAAFAVQIVNQSLFPEVSAEVALARRRHDRQRAVIATLAHQCKGQVGNLVGSGVSDLRKKMKEMTPVKLRGNHQAPVTQVPKLRKEGEYSKFFIAAD